MELRRRRPWRTHVAAALRTQTVESKGENEWAGGRREGAQLSKTKRARQGGAHATSELNHAAFGCCTQSAMKPRSTVQIFNSTSKVRLNIDMSPLLTPNPLRSGTKCSNKSCIATLNLQLCQYQHCLKIKGFQIMRHQSTLHENWKALKDLEIFSEFSNSTTWTFVIQIQAC